MKNNIIFSSLLVASLAVVSACGGDNNQPVPNVNCLDGQCGNDPRVDPRVPLNGAINNDFIFTQVLPNLQNQYGNIIIEQNIPFIGRPIPANSYTWVQFYQTYIFASITGNDCRLNNVNQNITSPWGTLNYNCFQSRVGQHVDAWTDQRVFFERTRHLEYYTSFYEVFDWFMNTGFSYTNNFYYPQVLGGTYDHWSGIWNNGICGYNPSIWGPGFFPADPFLFQQNNGWFLNINIQGFFGF